MTELLTTKPRRKPKSLAERFWPKIQVAGPDDCWLWTKGTSEGYGRIMLDSQVRPVKMEFAHRVAFYLANGRWPTDDARHTCHIRACCNPAHLVEGSRAQNMQDMVDAGRSLVGELQPNHKLTWAKVADARQRHTQGESASSLARACGVSERTMRQCLAGETWRMEQGER